VNTKIEMIHISDLMDTRHYEEGKYDGC
jgi:hypothetical protein